MNWLQKIVFKEAARVPKLKTMKIRDIQKFLQYQGFHMERQRGAHQTWGKPNWAMKPTVDMDHRGTLPIGTINDIARKIGLSLPEFAERVARMRGMHGFGEGENINHQPSNLKPAGPAGLHPKLVQEYIRRINTGEPKERVLQGLPYDWKDYILREM